MHLFICIDSTILSLFNYTHKHNNTIYNKQCTAHNILNSENIIQKKKCDQILYKNRQKQTKHSLHLNPRPGRTTRSSSFLGGRHIDFQGDFTPEGRCHKREGILSVSRQIALLNRRNLEHINLVGL